MWPLHHKTNRKTNHELNEEDRNKLAIGYRLSAIGYRLSAISYQLILGVSVSVFAVTAFAADCKVNDSDISAEYVGGCVNGLAHGRGKAKGSDTYEGEFKQGNKHGKGVYSWSSGGTYEGNYLDDKASGKGVMIFPSGARYEGDWLKGVINGKGIWHYKDGTKYDGEFQSNRRHGFGKMTIPRNAYDPKNFSGNGTWVGDNYFLTGMFEDNTLILSCTSPQNCKQEQAKREAQERREAADRERDKATACNKYYNGYVGYVDYNNGKRDFWGQDIGNKYGRFVVLGSGGGSVSIKGVDGGSYPGYDKMDNVSCTWLREKER